MTSLNKEQTLARIAELAKELAELSNAIDDVIETKDGGVINEWSCEIYEAAQALKEATTYHKRIQSTYNSELKRKWKR